MMIDVKNARKVFTPEIEVLGERLLHHQCWFFGRDIFHPQGNLLIRYGFERFGVPLKQTGSNCYRFRGTDQSEINLWGWGVFYGQETGGIYIKRYDFRPRLFSFGRLKIPVFKSEHLPPSHLPREDFQIKAARSLTLGFIEWILLYEDWIEKTCGKKWRQKCLREWENAELPAQSIRRNWKNLTAKIEKL